MRLRLVATDRDPFWIVGDPALSVRGEMSLALNERIQITRNQQAVTGAEWEGQLHQDRKNQRVVVSANVRYEFTSGWEQMDFIARLASITEAEQLHRWEGEVWLRLDKPGTTEFKEWRLAEAVIGIAGTELDGEIGLRISYTVSFGGFTGEARTGASQLALLIGSEAPEFGMVLSISDLDALLVSYVSADTDYFAFKVSREYSGGSVGASSKTLLPNGDTPGVGQFELPLSSCGADLATALDAVGSFSLMDFTISGDDFKVFSPSFASFAHMLVEIEHHYTDGGGSHVELIFSESGALIPGATFRLIGTHSGTDYQLIGLAES